VTIPSVLERWRRLMILLRGYLAAVLSDLPLSRSSGSQTLLPLRGSPSIHRLKRRIVAVKAVSRSSSVSRHN
jgi:hypothetical protein